MSMNPEELIEELGEVLPEEEIEDLFAGFDSNILDPAYLLPKSDDYTSWFNLDQSFKETIRGNFEKNKQFTAKRALSKYFGSCEIAEDMFSKYKDLFVVESYCNWLISDYKATSRSDTIGDKWLEDDSDLVITLVLEDFLEADCSLYKVESKSKDRFVLKNILNSYDYEATIIDQTLASKVKTGQILPARVYMLGDFDFCSPMGPPLSEAQWQEAKKMYPDYKIDGDPFVFEEQPLLYSRIWKYYDSLNPAKKGKKD
jgi:hypothetical protein